MVDQRDVAEQNFVDTFVLLAELLPEGRIEHGEGVVHIHSGSPIPAFNPTIVRRRPESVPALLDAAVAFHHRHGSPAWSLRHPTRLTRTIMPTARKRGFTMLEEQPFMVLEPIPDPVSPAGVEITVAEELDALAVHYDVVARSFGVPAEVFAPLVAPEFLDERFASLVGWVDGVPVASAMLSISECEGIRSAGVYNVGTVDDHRRRGIGEVMTAHAAALGRERGCTLATLQSSPMGQTLYERMGYRTHAKWRSWTPPA